MNARHDLWRHEHGRANCVISLNVWLAGCVTLTATGEGATAAHTTLGVITQLNGIWPIRVARAPV